MRTAPSEVGTRRQAHWDTATLGNFLRKDNRILSPTRTTLSSAERRALACVAECFIFWLSPSPYPPAAFADFHYTETTKITGGSMLSVMKLAGPSASKLARSVIPLPIAFTSREIAWPVSARTTRRLLISTKRLSPMSIIRRRQYYTITFQQMKEQLEEAQREAAKHPRQQPSPKPDNTNTPDDEVRRGGAKHRSREAVQWPWDKRSHPHHHHAGY